MKPYLIRGWFQKGSNPIIMTAYDNTRFSVFGALSKDTFIAQMTEQKCNHKTYLQFLKSLLLKYNHILLVVDGARYHFEKKHVQKFYEAHKGKLKIIQLPPYSPELNPIEQTWKKIKKWLAITPWATKEEFEIKLALALNNPNFMVKMYEYYSH